MVRILLLIFGWASLIGSIIESGILLHGAWLIVAGDGTWDMPVETHIRDHLPFFYWLIEFAYAAFPEGIVRYFLGWPIFFYYPFRIVVSILIGGWALSTARRMKTNREAPGIHLERLGR